jgi:hypothetical protein
MWAPEQKTNYRFQGSLGTMVPNVWDYCESPHPFAALLSGAVIITRFVFLQLCFRALLYIYLNSRQDTYVAIIVDIPPTKPFATSLFWGGIHLVNHYDTGMCEDELGLQNAVLPHSGLMPAGPFDTDEDEK